MEGGIADHQRRIEELPGWPPDDNHQTGLTVEQYPELVIVIVVLIGGACWETLRSILGIVEWIQWEYFPNRNVHPRYNSD